MNPTRETYWARKLRPIHLGAEPVETQLDRKLAAMVVITILTLVIGLIMLSIFAGFGRLDIGLRILGIGFLPATLWFWLDYTILRSRASAYLRERGGSPINEFPSQFVDQARPVEES